MQRQFILEMLSNSIIDYRRTFALYAQRSAESCLRGFQFAFNHHHAIPKSMFSIEVKAEFKFFIEWTILTDVNSIQNQ